MFTCAKAKAGKGALYGESINLESHMAKNSEWGVTLYLAHSKYGINKQEIKRDESRDDGGGNTSSYYTGGTNQIEQIYTIYNKQSTTYNATGIYNLHGGKIENVSSYVGNKNPQLQTDGGTNIGDLYGATEAEQSNSTKYKTVYDQDYELAGKKHKGDAIYETSKTEVSYTGTWFNSLAMYPSDNSPFFFRGGGAKDLPLYTPSSFLFQKIAGGKFKTSAIRLVLVP